MVSRDDALQATYATTFYHVTLRNADGSAVRARVNGRCKTWKTRPAEFRLPVKYGLRDCFYITETNADEWLTYDPTEEKRQREFREKRKAALRKSYGLADDCPDAVLHDRMLDDGMTPEVARIVCS